MLQLTIRSWRHPCLGNRSYARRRWVQWMEVDLHLGQCTLEDCCSGLSNGPQEGLLTVVIASAAYFFVTNYPATAKFLTNEEREFIQQRNKADSDSTANQSFTWKEVSNAFTDIKVYLYALGFHTMSLPLYTLSLFFPSIIKGLSYSSAQAQLLTIPPYAIAFVLTITLAVLSAKYGRRAPFILGSSSLAIIGYIILLSQHRPGVSYLGTIFAAAGIYPSVALVLAWPANNVSGQTKRAIANALQISIGNLWGGTRHSAVPNRDRATILLRPRLCAWVSGRELVGGVYIVVCC